MLILPLHKPLSRENFPLVTLLLLLLNVAVYLGWQRQDAVPLQQAQRYYLDSGLGAHEAPAYAHYLRRSGREDALAQFERVPAAQQAEFVGGASLNDVRFVQALRSGEALEDPAAQQAWAPLRARYDALLDRVFTLRHLQRSSEWSPARMLSSAFLHADGLHLFGNMLFLVVLGTLLEGAIGRWRFLLVYLLGAFGASAVSLAWRWGEAGGGLGASGAIAVDAATRALLFDRWLALGRLHDAEALLLQEAAAVPRCEQAQHWFRLALGHGERQAADEWRRLLLAVIERYPDLPQADKARFLLANA
ncbi:rhomboid family intramembrane serine protease [Xanthomonas translucens]|nr:rhomboid family intramembrane serine protease [Xanthomonas translucens]WLA02259.1 rhomboid family intramembrane serine protease [Xanthomonas translucens]